MTNMTNSCENCIHYPVCDNKNYNIEKPCDFYKEEKKGKWISNEPFSLVDPPYFCSECNGANNWKAPFCEHCGAEMRGHKE